MPPKSDPEMLALRAELEELYKNLKVPSYCFTIINLQMMHIFDNLGSPAKTGRCYH